MFLLVSRLLKFGKSIINKSLCLSQSIPSIFVSLAFVLNCCFAKFNSLVQHGSLVSNTVSLECYLCHLNNSCRNRVMESDFNFLTSFILPLQSPNHLDTYPLLLFQQPLKTLAYSCQNEHPKFPLI